MHAIEKDKSTTKHKNSYMEIILENCAKPTLKVTLLINSD